MAGTDQRVIDTKIPVTWLITSVCGIILAIGGVFVRVDNMAATITKIDNKAEVRDERFNVVLQQSPYKPTASKPYKPRSYA